MKYYRVKFSIAPNIQDAKDLLMSYAADAGFESFEDAEGGLNGYIQADFFDSSALDESLTEIPIQDLSIEYSVTEMEDKNWNEQWEKAGFAPIIVGKQCIIYDAKYPLSSQQLDGYRLPIAIDAQMAFGTGTHETTQMVVGQLIGMNLKGKRVLDCGCGTGILGIVAKKCGAEDVVGYDIDDWSVNNSQHNAEINHVEIEILEGNKTILSHVNGIFDVVVANINRNVLLADMGTFTEVMALHAVLVISGFYEDDASLLKAHAEELGLAEIGRTVVNNWCCLSFRYG